MKRGVGISWGCFIRVYIQLLYVFTCSLVNSVGSVMEPLCSLTFPSFSSECIRNVFLFLSPACFLLSKRLPSAALLCCILTFHIPASKDFPLALALFGTSCSWFFFCHLVSLFLLFCFWCLTFFFFSCILTCTVLLFKECLCPLVLLLFFFFCNFIWGFFFFFPPKI